MTDRVLQVEAWPETYRREMKSYAAKLGTTFRECMIAAAFEWLEAQRQKERDAAHVQTMIRVGTQRLDHHLAQGYDDDQT